MSQSSTSAAFATTVVRKDFWSTRHEATLNWLALGLLLAAWNAADNRPAPDLRRRPEALRGYTYVSVRAAQRVTSPPG